MEKNDIKNLIEAMKPVFATKEDLGVFPTAEMVQKGFKNTEERFEKVDAQFTTVNARLDKIDTRLTNIENKIPEKLNLEQLGEDMEAVKKAIGMTP